MRIAEATHQVTSACLLLLLPLPHLTHDGSNLEVFRHQKQKERIPKDTPLFRNNVMLILLGDNSFLFDTSLLTGKSAEVVQLSATNLTNLIHYDAVDSG